MEISKWTARVSEWLGERYSHGGHSGRRTCHIETNQPTSVSLPVQPELNKGDVGLTGVGADGGERCGLARALDVREALARGQVCGLRGGGGGDGDDLGAVDERAHVLPEHGHFGHCGGEFGHHRGLVGWGGGRAGEWVGEMGPRGRWMSTH